jgi:cytochrome P450
MTRAPFHPFAMGYTADPRPYFAEFHANGQLFEHAEFGAWFAHDYDAVRSFCDHPQMTRRPGAIPSLDPGGITWDPTNILLREITSMPIHVR